MACDKEEEELSKLGRNPHEKTEENIQIATSLASYGLPTIQIAAALDISEPTLFKYYREDMIKARAIANGRIGQTLYQKARSGDIRALIWWSKTQMGWKEEMPARSPMMQDQDYSDAISDENGSFETIRPYLHPKDQKILERLGVLNTTTIEE